MASRKKPPQKPSALIVTPDILYHGSGRGPVSFERRNGLAGHWGFRDQAITKIVHDYEDGKIKGFRRATLIPARIAIRNPVRMDDVHFDDSGEMIENLVELGILTEAETAGIPHRTWGKNIPKVVALLTVKGYDGIVYRNRIEGDGDDSWIPFRPAQIQLRDPVNVSRECREVARAMFASMQETVAEARQTVSLSEAPALEGQAAAGIPAMVR